MPTMRTVRLQSLHRDQIDAEAKWIHFGSWTMKAPVIRQPKDHIAVPMALLQRFSLPIGQPIGQWTSPDGQHIHLGPVLGVMMEPGPAGLSAEQIRFMTETKHQARKRGVVPVFFDLGTVDGDAGTVRPIYPPGEGDQSAPIPDIVYDRITSIRPRMRRQVNGLRQRLRVMYGTTFVSGAIGMDPGTTYRAIQFFPGTRSVMPVTGPVSSPRHLRRWLARWGGIVLYHGRRSSRGPMFYIEYLSRTGGGYRVEGEGVGPFGDELFSDLPSLLRFLRRLGGRGPWFIQRADERRRLGGRHFYIRMFMQKGAGGNWRVARLHVHWSGPGDEVPEKSRPSPWMDLDEFMFYWLVYEGHDTLLRRVVDGANNLGPVVAEVVETRFGHHAELILNIGMDGQGGPVLLGVDARPGLWDGTGHPIEYAKFVAERVWRSKYGALQSKETLRRGVL